MRLPTSCHRVCRPRWRTRLLAVKHLGPARRGHVEEEFWRTSGLRQPRVVNCGVFFQQVPGALVRCGIASVANQDTVQVSPTAMCASSWRTSITPATLGMTTWSRSGSPECGAGAQLHLCLACPFFCSCDEQVVGSQDCLWYCVDRVSKR